MQRLGYACLEKVWLQFNCDPFWPTDVDTFRFLDESATPFQAWMVPARIYDSHMHDRTLLGWVGGSEARALAGKSPAEVGAQALEALCKFLPVPANDENILQDVHVTSWSTDPWSGHGSYSSMVVGSTPEDFRLFEGSCFENRLWFAGEATCAEYQSTVHGAYVSGERAAKACFASIGEYN